MVKKREGTVGIQCLYFSVSLVMLWCDVLSLQDVYVIYTVKIH
jgi:hypothetical protein